MELYNLSFAPIPLTVSDDEVLTEINVNYGGAANETFFAEALKIIALDDDGAEVDVAFRLLNLSTRYEYYSDYTLARAAVSTSFVDRPLPVALPLVRNVKLRLSLMNLSTRVATVYVTFSGYVATDRKRDTTNEGFKLANARPYTLTHPTFKIKPNSELSDSISIPIGRDEQFIITRIEVASYRKGTLEKVHSMINIKDVKANRFITSQFTLSDMLASTPTRDKTLHAPYRFVGDGNSIETFIKNTGYEAEIYVAYEGYIVPTMPTLQDVSQ